MHKTSEEYNQFTEKYCEFIEEYEKFLQNYEHSSRLVAAMKTSNQQKTEVGVLYDKALQAHIDTTNTYIQTVAIYRQLVQKWLLMTKSCYKRE